MKLEIYEYEIQGQSIDKSMNQLVAERCNWYDNEATQDECTYPWCNVTTTNNENQEKNVCV